MVSLFTTVFDGIGKATGEMAEYARMRVGEGDNLLELRRAQLQLNQPSSPFTSVHSDTSHKTNLVAPCEKIFETKSDPKEVDPVNESRASEGKPCAYTKVVCLVDVDTQKIMEVVRSIPHFAHIHINTLLHLPQHIFRVVHSKSAGKVVNKNGVFQFQSQAYLENDDPSNFGNFSMEDITEQLMCHISGRTTYGRKSFASHFVSTTDSFERAINKAQRHYSKRDVRDVMIYVIDTESLQSSALVFLMALALRAWDVLRRLPEWKTPYFMYGALTEWIFWDNIVTSKVHKIDYGTFAYPPRRADGHQSKRLEDIIPRVVRAGRYPANSAKGVSRTVLHATIYPNGEQERATQSFALPKRASRNGR